MAENCTRSNLINCCIDIMYGEHTTYDDFFNLLDTVPFNELSDFELTWCLNTINLLQVVDMPKFYKVRIERARLLLLAGFMDSNAFYKDIYYNSDDNSTEEVLTSNEYGTIYKRYLPTRQIFFQLPLKDETDELNIVGYTEDQRQFFATVEIDHQGYVRSVKKMPEEKTTNKEPVDFSDLYTDLMSDVLTYAG